MLKCIVSISAHIFLEKERYVQVLGIFLSFVVIVLIIDSPSLPRGKGGFS